MRNSTFLSTVIIIIVLSQCFQANAWRRRRRRRSPVIKPPVIKPPSPKFVPAPRNPSGIPLCKGEIDVNQILQRGASGRKKRSVKRQVSVLKTIYWPHLRGLLTLARLARLAGLTRVTNGRFLFPLCHSNIRQPRAPPYNYNDSLWNSYNKPI